MANYTKVFADTYPNGWQAKPDTSTPYTTDIKNNEDATFRSIEDYLYNNPIGSGGGKTYTTTEEEVGTDESGNTVYSKTLVINFDPNEWKADGTYLIECDFNISDKYIVRDYEGIVVFYPNGYDEDFCDNWVMPYFSPDLLLEDQSDGKKMKYAQIAFRFYNLSEPYQTTPMLEVCNWDVNYGSSSNIYKYVKFCKLTIFYTKITTE